jgi:alkaline phosphatase D
MDRRTFLRATLVTAGSMVVGCGDDESGTDAGISDAGDDSGADIGMDTEVDVARGRPLEDGSAFFPQSVASGDPKPNSVILWTRVKDATNDIVLELEVALDDRFTQLVTLDGEASMEVVAQAAFDHCVKVRLTGLDSATHYYYRFIHTSDGTEYGSKTGRAKTAPAPDADVPVRFGIASCQDFNGRYYNTYKQMLKEELDFFVHLGDYVYETTEDPAFQAASPDRFVSFEDTGGAIVFNGGTDSEFYAAKSLSNYRELYRIYRSDVNLQAVHERFPMIAVWDDHEFSDDCFGATATYYDGAADELDVSRRKAANQAWYEYMPVDYMDDEDFVYDPDAEYLDDIRIYRDFGFGANLHLIMTDLRSYRSDHLIPEDALPGAIAMTQAELNDSVGEIPDFAIPYTDIATWAAGAYQTALRGAAEEEGYDPALITGNLSVEFINGVIERRNEREEDEMALITEEEADEMDRGMAFSQMFKVSTYSILGSRYLTIKDTFDIYAAFRFEQSDGESEVAMGEDQKSWFMETITDSTKTWKVWGNEYCLINRTVNLTELPLPEAFRKLFKLSAEDWDGLPNRRDEYITALSAIDNVIAITGDIHAFFASTPWVSDDESAKIIEFVTAAISSGTYQDLLLAQANSNATLREAGAPALAGAVDQILQDPLLRPNPNLAHAVSSRHGYSVIDLDADGFEATFHAIEKRWVDDDLPADELDEKFESVTFRVEEGSYELYKDIDGEWKRWDSDTMTWV